MVERIDWKRQVEELDQQIEEFSLQIPSAYWVDVDIPVFPGSQEYSIAFDEVYKQGLPSPDESIKILENRKNEKYLDILRAELTVHLIKRRRILEANLSPGELEERSKMAGKNGWFIPSAIE